MMLTTEEKNDLYAIIVASLGEDSSIRAAKNGFNELTVELVEQALIEQAKCNQSMKNLVRGLLNGSSFLVKGWLRRNIQRFAKTLNDEKIRFNGYGCVAQTKATWKTSIITTTF
jgi:hypothetical protein